MKRVRIFVLLAASSFLFIQNNKKKAFAAETCGQAQVISGSKCEYLNIKFDLSGCPGESLSQITAKTKGCDGAEPVAYVDIESGHYEANLTKPVSENGAWIVGAVNFGRPQEAVGVKPTAKPSETPYHAKVSPPKKTAVSVASASSSGPVLARPPFVASTPALQPVSSSASAVSSTPPAVESATSKAWPFSVKGQFRTRSEVSEYTDLVNVRRFTTVRLRPTLTFQPKSHLTVVFEPQFARNFGQNVESDSSPGSTAQSSGTIQDPELSVHQAYAEYKAGDFQLRAGRTTLSYGDELVVGALEWNNVGRAFDALKGRYTFKAGWADLFAAKLVDTNIAASSLGDKNLYGLYGAFDLGTYAKNFDLYIIYQDDSTIYRPATVGTHGLRVKAKIGSAFYRIEANDEWGTGVRDDAYQANLEFGWLFGGKTKLQASVEGFIAGKNYYQFYPTAHKWLGYADVVGRRNLSGGALHLSAVPSEKWKVQVDYHYFSRTDEDATAFKLDSSTAIGATTASNSKDVGSEIDLTLNYEFDDALAISGGYSWFWAGQYIDDQFNAIDDPTFAYIQATVKF